MSTDEIFQREVLTISELTGRIKGLLEASFGQVWLVGEISNFQRHSSGHIYMTLKDQGAQIRTVLFRTRQRYLAFEPANGQEVLVRGRLTVYELRGEYQILVDYMEPRGEGALRLAFEGLKRQLAAEGLFDPARKKRLPFLPRRVAIVTSITGAAIRDFIRVSRRRFANVCLSVYPVRVQGEGAAQEIAQAVIDLNRWGEFDLIVLTRGGGSIEDLWAFNEEVVARAVAASNIPVVSAVGHEIDFTISDFVADLRAPTPSAAAELIFREKKELKVYLQGMVRRLMARLRGQLDLSRERLAHTRTRLGDPAEALANPRQRLDDLTEAMITTIKLRLSRRRQAWQALQARLTPTHPRLRLKMIRNHLVSLDRDIQRFSRMNFKLLRDRLHGLDIRLKDLSPLAVLERGYALARSWPDLAPVKSSRSLTPGNKLDLMLAEGEIMTIVDEVLR